MKGHACGACVCVDSLVRVCPSVFVCMYVKCVFVRVWRGSHAFLFSRKKQTKKIFIYGLQNVSTPVLGTLYFYLFFLRYVLEGTQVICLLPIIIYTLVRVTEYVCPKRNRVRVIYGCVDEVDLASARGACSGFYFSCTFRQRHLATILLYILPCFYSRPGVSTSRIFFFLHHHLHRIYIYIIFFVLRANTRG